MPYNFQRKGSVSNAHVGKQFEDCCEVFLQNFGWNLTRSFAVPIGYTTKKLHRFDFGSNSPSILVECRSNTWTEGGRSPSAKIRGINETMLHFHLAPRKYRKIFFMLKHIHSQRNISLATHYIATQSHLIPSDVEIWELDPDSKNGDRLR